MAYLDSSGNEIPGGGYSLEVQPNRDIINQAKLPAGFVANPGETPLQTYQRYVNDYHSPDRDQLLASVYNEGIPQGGNSGSSAPPSGGNIQDPTYARQLVDYYAQQPGADPSLANDPNYWVSKLTSGAFGADQGYAVNKFQNARFEGQSSDGGVNQPFSYAAPTTPAYNYTPFTAPTAEEAANQPGFQAAVGTADSGLLRQRAALGSLLTGGTLQDLSTLNAGLGAQNYQNVYSNAANQNAMNNAGYLQQHNTSLSDYEQGLQNALGIYGTNQAVNQQSFNNAFNVGQTGFSNQLSLAQLGLNAAGGVNAAGANYGNAANNLYTGIGNANAAGTVGSANAWNGGLTNLANLGLGYASLYGNQNTQKNGYNPNFPG